MRFPLLFSRQLSAPLGFLFVLIFAKPSQKQEEGNEVMAPFLCFFFFERDNFNFSFATLLGSSSPCDLSFCLPKIFLLWNWIFLTIYFKINKRYPASNYANSRCPAEHLCKEKMNFGFFLPFLATFGTKKMPMLMPG